MLKQAAIFVLATIILASFSGLQPARAQAKPATMEFNKTPWAKVFESLANQTELPYVSKYAPPKGTVTYSTPKGQKQTLDEAINILNIGLEQHGFMLIRREKTLRMVPTKN